MFRVGKDQDACVPVTRCKVLRSPVLQGSARRLRARSARLDAQLLDQMPQPQAISRAVEDSIGLTHPELVIDPCMLELGSGPEL